MNGGLERRLRVSEAADFGRVAVMLGGTSGEREVSLLSGEVVLKALQARGVDAHAWDAGENSLADFAAAGFDRVWNALHGPGGEDGAIQGALEWLSVPYTGSGVLASALAMDKVRSKHLFGAAGIATPAYAVVRGTADAKRAADEIGFPLMIKPAGQGSSLGMSKVFQSDELDDAVELALGYDDCALVERCIVGDEITVSVLQGQALPSIRIETPRVFYDYQAKYESDRTEYACPSTDDAQVERRYAELSLQAFEVLGCRGWGTCRFHARSWRRADGHRSQHGARHDQPQPRADGGEIRGDRTRRAVLENPGNEFCDRHRRGGECQWRVNKPSGASSRSRAGGRRFRFRFPRSASSDLPSC